MTTEQINSIIIAFELGQEYFVWQIGNSEDLDQDERLEQFYELVIVPKHSDEDHEKVFALMQHTGENWEEAESQIDSYYKVLTDDEANELLDERLEDHINDCVLCNIDQCYHQYFDREVWKSDNDLDRGAWLDYESGSEDEETVNGTTYYIYKQ